MTLTLDYRQRLNLIAVLGNYDVKGRELHAVWHLQDLLELNQTEKEFIQFREETMNGQRIQQWDDSKTVPVRNFDLSAADLDRVRKAIEDFPQFRGSRDRVWLEPLLAQLDGSADSEHDLVAVRGNHS